MNIVKTLMETDFVKTKTDLYTLLENIQARKLQEMKKIIASKLGQLQESIQDLEGFFNHPKAFMTAKKKVTINHVQATGPGSVKTLEGDRTYEAGAHIMGPGPKGEKWPISTHEKFSKLYDDNGDGTATTKQIPKKARLVNTGGHIKSAYGKLKFEKGKHYIVQHGPGDYGVVEKSIFDQTYEPPGTIKP